MGSQINQILDLEASWHKECEDRDLRCKSCLMHPPYDEKDVFLETGICRFCHEQAHNRK